jgi:hypothetical protein
MSRNTNCQEETKRLFEEIGFKNQAIIKGFQRKELLTFINERQEALKKSIKKELAVF